MFACADPEGGRVRPLCDLSEVGPYVYIKWVGEGFLCCFILLLSIFLDRFAGQYYTYSNVWKIPNMSKFKGNMLVKISN